MIKSKFLMIVFYVFLVGFGVEVVFLVIQNRELQKTIIQMAKNNKAPTLEIGNKVQPIDLISLAGSKTKLEYGREKSNRLLFVFKTGCQVCTKSIPTWKKLFENLKETLEIFAISGRITLHSSRLCERTCCYKLPNL